MSDRIFISRELAYRLLGDACNENWSDLNWFIHTQPSDGALTNEGVEPVLSKPAKVGSVRFGKGIKERLVIEAAQRHFEYALQPEVEEDRLERLRATIAAVHTPAPASVVLPEGFMIVERGIWTEEQVDSAAKCIELLKDVPGMKARDLALAAMDAGHCKAPDITLSDFACIDRVKELNP